MLKRQVAKNDYTVGWVCVLSFEMIVVKCMLKKIHEDFEEQDTSDHNNYQFDLQNSCSFEKHICFLSKSEDLNNEKICDHRKR